MCNDLEGLSWEGRAPFHRYVQQIFARLHDDDDDDNGAKTDPTG